MTKTKVPIDGALGPLCNAHVGTAAEGISSLVGRIDTFAERELARLAPTGSTPIKKEWVIPTQARAAGAPKARQALGELIENSGEISEETRSTFAQDTEAAEADRQRAASMRELMLPETEELLLAT